MRSGMQTEIQTQIRNRLRPVFYVLRPGLSGFWLFFNEMLKQPCKRIKMRG